MPLFLFDVDGTLVSGLGPYEASLEKAIGSEFGKEVKVDLTNFHGLTDRAILREILKENQTRYDEASIGRCLAYFGEHYVASKEKTTALPFAFYTLKTLSERGEHLGIVTGNVEAMARKKLALCDLSKFLPFGAFGEESYNRDDLVAIAMNRAIVREWEGEKNEIYVIGDTPRDIEAAVQAGVVPIGVATGKATKQDLERAGARKVLSRLIELVDL